MSTPPAQRGSLDPELSTWAGRKRARARAENTQRAYAHHWQQFENWCFQNRIKPLPATVETMVRYLKELEQADTLAVSSISVRLAAIKHVHRIAGLVPPTVDGRFEEIWAGFQREHGRPPRQAWALTPDDIKKMLAECPNDLGGDRDAALLLVGFAGGFRRSELVSLDVEHIRWHERGAIVTIQRSKTDAVGKGRVVAIPMLQPATCPARHLAAYLKRAGIRSGAVFRGVDRSGWQLSSDRLTAPHVSEIVKRLAGAIGLDTSHYSGHSLRAGFITSAKKGGADPLIIARSSGHKNLSTLAEYIRTGDPFEECAAYNLGL